MLLGRAFVKKKTPQKLLKIIVHFLTYFGFLPCISESHSFLELNQIIAWELSSLTLHTVVYSDARWVIRKAWGSLLRILKWYLNWRSAVCPHALGLFVFVFFKLNFQVWWGLCFLLGHETLTVFFLFFFFLCKPCSDCGEQFVQPRCVFAV